MAIQLPPNSTGTVLDTVTVATKDREIVVLGDGVAATTAAVGANGLKVDPSGVTQPVSGTVTANQGTAAAPASKWPIEIVDSAGVNIASVSAANALKVDGSAVTQPVSGTVTANQGTANATPWNENVSQYGGTATTLGQKVAASSMPVVPASDWATVDATFKALRTTERPPEVLGVYMVQARTPTYAALAAGAPLFSMRWGNAANVALIYKVRIFVITTVTATTAGLTERELIIARSFTVSDSGGTVITLTGNNQKLRTSFGTSLVTDMRVGGALVAGTRTLDAQPIASVAGWSPLTSVGMVIGSTAGGAVATSGGISPVTLWDATMGGNLYPITLAQNEGIIIRIGKDAQPAGATQQSYVEVLWAEAAAF